MRKVLGSIQTPDRTNTQDLKITVENVLQMVTHSSLLGQGLQTVGPVSCIFIVTWLAGGGKEPTNLSQRVGHVIPGVVVWPCPTGWCFT